jgi:hypothetical protein
MREDSYIDAGSVSKIHIQPLCRKSILTRYDSWSSPAAFKSAVSWVISFPFFCKSMSSTRQPTLRRRTSVQQNVLGVHQGRFRVLCLPSIPVVRTSRSLSGLYRHSSVLLPQHSSQNATVGNSIRTRSKETMSR